MYKLFLLCENFNLKVCTYIYYNLNALNLDCKDSNVYLNPNTCTQNVSLHLTKCFLSDTILKLLYTENNFIFF